MFLIDTDKRIIVKTKISFFSKAPPPLTLFSLTSCWVHRCGTSCPQLSVPLCLSRCPALVGRGGHVSVHVQERVSIKPQKEICKFLLTVPALSSHYEIVPLKDVDFKP